MAQPIMDELNEALTAAGVSALVQKVIDPLLLEYQRRYSPLVRAIPAQQWSSTDYYFNQRTSRVPGGFVTDGGARPVGSSSYSQSSFKLRNLQAVGAVTGYAQEVTRGLMGDLRRVEIEGAVQGLLWDVESALNWGSAAATAAGPYPQFDGFDALCATLTGVNQNVQEASGATLSLGWLDKLIDQVESNAATPVSDSDWMFVMSPTADSKIAQLQVSQQRYMQVEVTPGLNVSSYRNIPIIKSSFLNARNAAMSTVTATPSNTGGTLANGDGAYKYKVTAVFARYGESSPAAEVTATVASGSSGSVSLAFTPPAGPDGATPVVYRVYRTAGGGATNTEVLLGVVDGVVVLGADGITPTVTTSIIDTGSALVPMNSSTAPTTVPTAYVGPVGLKPPASGGEDIYLLSRNRDFVVRPYVRDIRPVDVYPTTSSPDSLPFALVSDTCLAVRAAKYIGRLHNVVTTLST